MKKSSKDGFGIVGLGAVACAACCAGPLLAILGGLSLAGLASTLLVGAVGLAVFVAAGVAYIVVRRQRQAAVCAPPPTEPVPVTAAKRKVPTSTIAGDDITLGELGSLSEARGRTR